MSTLYKKKAPLLLFLIPAFLFMIVFLYYPFFMNIINSFMNIDGLGSSATGLNQPAYANYTQMFKDEKMITALKNTFIMMGLTVVFQIGIALVLAILIDGIKKFSQVFRTVYFFPIVISATALGLLFNLIFLYDGGMINNLLMKFGMTKLIDWKSPSNFMVTMSVPVIWQYVGFYFVILLTGLNGISKDIYEAAEIDGAKSWEVVFKIKIPLLYNTLITCLILGITGALKIFDLPFVMFKNGMPEHMSWLTGTYMHYQTFTVGDVDYGSAIAIVIVVLGVALSQIANSIFKPKEF